MDLTRMQLRKALVLEPPPVPGWILDAAAAIKRMKTAFRPTLDGRNAYQIELALDAHLYKELSRTITGDDDAATDLHVYGVPARRYPGKLPDPGWHVLVRASSP